MLLKWGLIQYLSTPMKLAIKNQTMLPYPGHCFFVSRTDAYKLAPSKYAGRNYVNKTWKWRGRFWLRKDWASLLLAFRKALKSWLFPQALRRGKLNADMWGSVDSEYGFLKYTFMPRWYFFVSCSGLWNINLLKTYIYTVHISSLFIYLFSLVINKGLPILKHCSVSIFLLQNQAWRSSASMEAVA